MDRQIGQNYLSPYWLSTLERGICLASSSVTAVMYIVGVRGVLSKCTGSIIMPLRNEL